MKKLYLAYLLLTSLFIAIAYKVKDDYFYLPYPNAIEYILAFTLFCITLILLIKRKHRSQKIILGLASMATLLVLTNSMTYFFEWHPLNLSPPFSSSQSVEVNYEPYNWQTSTPASVGYSDAAIKQYLHDIEGWERLRGLIVIKDGKVVVEKYQGGATRHSAFNVHSVTKSISSALTGIAIHKGYLPSDQALVLPYFPEYGRNLPTQRPKSPLTVAHLLSMRGGFKGWDGAQNVEQALVSEGISEDKVGQEFKYYTGSHMVLSALLNKATHTPTKDFAQEELFKPLGIHCAFWRKVDGYYAGGDETYFTARDLARFGYLYLNKGNVDGVQLLDSAWVAKSFTNYTRESNAFRTLGCYQEVGYGYSWWLLNFGDQKIYTARGKGGQHVLVMPEQNVVAVILQEWNRRKDAEKENAYLCQLLSILTTNGKQLAGKGTD